MKISKVETFLVRWGDVTRPVEADFGAATAVVAIHADGMVGLGEASPMQGGVASLAVIARDMAPSLVGADALDHAVTLDRLLHRLIKLGPDGIVTGALAAIDIALWDLKGKAFRQPIYKLLGGAWRTRIPFYASIGNNGARDVDGVVKAVEARFKAEHPSAIKIRWDGARGEIDRDIAGDIAKARAVRRLVGDDFPLAFDANNRYSIGAAIRVGRVLEDLGYLWFEEPVESYHPKAMGEVAQRLDITVSAGEQSYTLQSVAALIESGVRMVQPDIVKMGGVTGLMQCASLCHAHGVEFVPHQTQPAIGNAANLHVLATHMRATKPAELADGWSRCADTFVNAPKPDAGCLVVPDGPGLGLAIDEAMLARRRVELTG
jgi:L-alanine-DL-glutamate epimerase-like enolase superfamily enzyme